MKENLEAHQGDIDCGASSQADFSLNYFLSPSGQSSANERDPAGAGRGPAGRRAARVKVRRVTQNYKDLNQSWLENHSSERSSLNTIK